MSDDKSTIQFGGSVTIGGKTLTGDEFEKLLSQAETAEEEQAQTTASEGPDLSEPARCPLCKGRVVQTLEAGDGFPFHCESCGTAYPAKVRQTFQPFVSPNVKIGKVENSNVVIGDGGSINVNK